MPPKREKQSFLRRTDRLPKETLRDSAPHSDEWTTDDLSKVSLSELVAIVQSSDKLALLAKDHLRESSYALLRKFAAWRFHGHRLPKSERDNIVHTFFCEKLNSVFDNYKVKSLYEFEGYLWISFRNFVLRYKKNETQQQKRHIDLSLVESNWLARPGSDLHEWQRPEIEKTYEDEHHAVHWEFVRKKINLLPPKQRTVMFVYIELFQTLDIAQESLLQLVAQELSVPANTVKVTLYRARKLLRTLCAEDERLRLYLERTLSRPPSQNN